MIFIKKSWVDSIKNNPKTLVYDDKYYIKSIYEDYCYYVSNIDCDIQTLMSRNKDVYLPWNTKFVYPISNTYFRLVKSNMPSSLIGSQNERRFNDTMYVDTDGNLYVFHVSYRDIPIWEINYSIRKGELGYGFYLLVTLQAISNFWEYHVRSGLRLDKVNIYKYKGTDLEIRGGSTFITYNGGQLCWKSYQDAKDFEYIDCCDRFYIGTWLGENAIPLNKYLWENSIPIRIFN